MTLAAIAEDTVARLITQAELLANASDIDSAGLSATGLSIAAGGGTLVNNGNGTWSYTPALNDDTSVSFDYSVSDGTAFAAGSAALDITPVNDAPVSSPVTLAAIAEDSGARLITQAELLANASDIDSAGLSATGLSIAAGQGTLVNNGNGTWSYTPALNDDSAVSFSYSVSDGTASQLAARDAGHHAGERRAGDRARDPRGDRRRQRRAADHAGRAAGQRKRHRQRRPHRNGPEHRRRQRYAWSTTATARGATRRR